MDKRNDVKNKHCNEVGLLSIAVKIVIYTSEWILVKPNKSILLSVVPGKVLFFTPSHTFYSLLARKIFCEHLTITIHTSKVSLVVLVQIQHHNDKPLCFEALSNPVTNSLFPPLFAFPEFHNLSSWGSAMLSFLLLWLQLLGLLQVSLQCLHIN